MRKKRKLGGRWRGVHHRVLFMGLLHIGFFDSGGFLCTALELSDYAERVWPSGTPRRFEENHGESLYSLVDKQRLERWKRQPAADFADIYSSRFHGDQFREMGAPNPSPNLVDRAVRHHNVRHYTDNDEDDNGGENEGEQYLESKIVEMARLNVDLLRSLTTKLNERGSNFSHGPNNLLDHKQLQGTRRRKRQRKERAFGKSEFLLPENFGSLRRKEIPVTYRLHDDLLRYYRKGTRPVTHPSKIITVTMSVFLYQIIKLDAVKNTISLSGSFELYWQDEFLQWSPDSYEGATEIFLSSSDIWIPEFSLYYSLNFNDAVKLISNNDVRVNYTGHIRYYLPFSSESLCNSVDVKFFPFDIQQCTLLFGSWAHSNDSIKYSLYSKNLSLIDFYDNQEWQLDLTRSHIMSDGFLYDYLDPPLFWEMIVIDLVVARQSFYYVFNLVIPSAIITLVAVIGFHTPSTSGRMRDAKFRLGIMTLMSMSMILLAVVEDMPKFSISSNRKGRGSFSGVPLIGLYYFMLLAIVGLSTVTTSMFVFVEREMKHRHDFPWYLKPFAFDMIRSGDENVGRSNRNMSHRFIQKKKQIFDGVKSKSLFSFRVPSHDDLAATEALLSSANIHPTNSNFSADGSKVTNRHSLQQQCHPHGYINGFAGGGRSTSTDGAAAVFSGYSSIGDAAVVTDSNSGSRRNYAQNVALSILKLIPPSTTDGSGGGRRNTGYGSSDDNNNNSLCRPADFVERRRVSSAVTKAEASARERDAGALMECDGVNDSRQRSHIGHPQQHHHRSVALANSAVMDSFAVVNCASTSASSIPLANNNPTSSESTTTTSNAAGESITLSPPQATKSALPPRRKRFSLVNYDNILVYECLNQLLENLSGCMLRIERTVRGIRYEVNSHLSHNELESFRCKWEIAIRRMEILSLIFYISVLFTTMYLFFYHDWSQSMWSTEP